MLCSTAEEALRELEAELLALVVLDVGLPDLNGFALFRRLQALPGGNQVPVLFLTTRSEEIDRVVGLELGADDYIAKFFSPHELVACVRTMLRCSARPAEQPMAPAPLANAPVDRPIWDLDEDRNQQAQSYLFRTIAGRWVGHGVYAVTAWSPIRIRATSSPRKSPGSKTFSGLSPW